MTTISETDRQTPGHRTSKRAVPGSSFAGRFVWLGQTPRCPKKTKLKGVQIPGRSQRTGSAKPTVIITQLVSREEQGGKEVVAVDGARYLREVGRRCPDCNQVSLIGHGRRLRVYRKKPVRRGLPLPETWAYRVLCKSCHHSHTILPVALGPHKHYVLPVIESAVRWAKSGVPIGRVSARLSGVSPERIATWCEHVGARLPAACRAAEMILMRDPLFRPPAAMPLGDLFAYLQSLLGTGPSDVLFILLNAVFSANLPLGQPLLLYPPTSSGSPSPARPRTRTGGVPDG